MPLNAHADSPLLAIFYSLSGRAQRTFLICDGGLLQADGMMVGMQEIP